MDRPLAVAFLGVGLSGLLALTVSPALAAKKYYPKGFTPPSNNQILPGTTPEKPAEPETAEPVYVAPEVRTITIPVPVQAKPKDEMTRLLEERHFSEAMRLVEQRIQKNPREMSLRLLHAYIQREKENFLTSETEYQWVISHTPSKDLKAKGYSGLGWTQLAHSRNARTLGDMVESEELLKQAEQSFQQAIQRDRKLHTAWTGLAQLHLTRGKLPEAEQAITRAGALAPSDTQLLLAKGQYQIQNGNPSQGLNFLFKAKQQAPGNPQVYLLLGQAYIAMNRVDDGMIQLQHLLEQDPDHHEALKLLSEAYTNKMKPADAEAALRKAVFLNPGDVDTAMSLLKIYDAGEDPTKSITLLENLIDLQPRQPRYTQELFIRLEKVSRWETIYQKGIAMLATPEAKETTDLTALPGMDIFLKSVYIHGKRLLYRESMFEQPELARVRGYYTQQALEHPAGLHLRLGTLLLDPTTPLPPLPSGLETVTDTWPVLIQIAYLQGQPQMHQQLLSLLTQFPAMSDNDRLALAETLYALGDYKGSMTLADAMLKTNPGALNALTLKERLQKAQEQVASQLKGIQMLSSRSPKAYWDSNAEDALKWASGNWQVHATLADTLWDRRDYTLALSQQKLAALYAPNEKERTRWLKKVQKTQEKLGVHPSMLDAKAPYQPKP